MDKRRQECLPGHDLASRVLGFLGPWVLLSGTWAFGCWGSCEAAEQATLIPEAEIAAMGFWPPNLQPTTLLKSLIECLEIRGLKILDPSTFLAPYLCPEGVLGNADGGASVLADAAFGWPLVKALADLDIGQTLVVKRRAVVAVEGMEGTDAAIRRGARLAGAGFSVVKAGRSVQDMRLDVPAVGLDTVRSLVRAGGAALAVDAGKVVFFQKSEALELAERHGLAVVARPALEAGEGPVG